MTLSTPQGRNSPFWLATNPMWMLSVSGEVVLNPGLNTVPAVVPGVVPPDPAFLSPQPPIANTAAAIQSAVEKYFAVMTVSPSNLRGRE